MNETINIPPRRYTRRQLWEKLHELGSSAGSKRRTLRNVRGPEGCNLPSPELKALSSSNAPIPLGAPTGGRGAVGCNPPDQSGPGDERAVGGLKRDGKLRILTQGINSFFSRTPNKATGRCKKASPREREY